MKFSLFVLLLFSATFARGELPNVVIFLVDDVGYGETGMQGGKDIPTPNIDKLARNGIRFTNGYVTASYCSPSRAGLLTGKYQNRFGYTKNYTRYLNEDPDFGLPLKETTIAEYLSDAGYVSGIFGKWHLGGTAKYHPYRHGFDEFFGFLHEGHYYVPQPYRNVTSIFRRRVLPGGGEGIWTSEDGRTSYRTDMGMKRNEVGYDADNPLLRGSQPVNEPEYLTNAFTREGIDFIDRNMDKPFFLFLPYNACHSPLQAMNEYYDKFPEIDDIQRRVFAGMLSNIDDNVGKVMEKLRDEGLEENTIIIFLSDHGGPTDETSSSNYPLKGGKGTAYEGGIRIPFVIQWKAQLPGNITYNKSVISLDILPTLLAAADFDIPEKIDGVNLLPYLKGENKESPHPTLYWNLTRYMAFRKDDWKIVKPKSEREWQLYNLEKDVSEKEDLSETNPDKLNELVSEWYELNKEIN